MEIITIVSKFLRNLFNQNTYVLKKDNSALIIDAGAELEDIKKAVAGCKVEAILMTHLHFDHIWNIEQYLAEFDCNVYVCKGAEDKFSDYKKNASSVMRNSIERKVDKSRISYYEDSLKFDGFDIEVYFTPGHCKDCVCLKIENSLFSGDTIFAQSIGRTDIIDSDNNEMKESLRLIEKIDFDIYYPGHNESATKQQAIKVINYYLNNYL